MKKLAMFTVLAALSLGLLTACGGGGGEAKTIDVVMGEGGQYVFSPATLEVNKGDKVTFKLINKDTAADHSLVVPDLNFTSGAVPPNTTQEKTITANKQGTFDFWCDVPGHKEGNMVGKITVK